MMESSKNRWHELSPEKPSAEHLIPGLYALAKCWYDRGDYVPAEKIYRLIINIDDRVKNITCVEVVFSAYDLARLLSQDDRLMEAEHMFLRAINRCTHTLSQEHKIYAMILRSYGELLRKMNLDKEARALEARANDLRLQHKFGKREEDSAYTDTVVTSATIG